MNGISEAELEVMKVLWNAEESLCAAEIARALETHGWKRTTVSTFLVRLSEKGAVTAQKRGNQCFYVPNISKKEYRKAKMKTLIASLYQGSVKEFAASLFEEEVLSPEDLQELRSFLDAKED